MVSILQLEHLLLPIAELGPENPYPAFRLEPPAPPPPAGPRVPPEMAQAMAYGRLPDILPYTLQDGYDRHRTVQPVKVAVLENELLRASFLVDYGGRLWSLEHRPSGRELLYRNPVLQPGNLALRNAWFCGGVEWNTGATGHTPFTCAPLFAGRLARPDGLPLLRLYEYERWRGLVYQIDACLPPGSPVLLVQITITNPDPDARPVYWWSNIAVPEAEDVRVIAPAGEAFHFDLERRGLGLVPVPFYQGRDYTYTTGSPHAADYFFNILPGQRPFIAALDGGGSGLVQTSTARLRGRKLFCWGSGAGGRRWQEFLSPQGGRYLEIQAGLARTQLEHLQLPGLASWSWLEAYGLLQADPARIHGRDWRAARRAAEGALEELIPAAWLEVEYRAGAAAAEAPLVELFHSGSGWGALEALRQASTRRQADGEPRLSTPAHPFPQSSLGEPQHFWAGLLNLEAPSRLPTQQPDPQAVPLGFQVDPCWHGALERAAADLGRGSWQAHYYLGVLYLHQDQPELARAAWEAAQACQPTPWAARALAFLAWRQGDLTRARADYQVAQQLRPADPALAGEHCRFLLAAGEPGACLELIASLPEGLRQLGRLRFLEAQAALLGGDLARLERFFADQVEVPDLREGEDSLSELWFAYQQSRLEKESGAPVDRWQVEQLYPVPGVFDFRMRVE
jgi:tetratricopeptide (TPR) repeat protein